MDTEMENEFDELEIDPLVEDIVPQESRYFKNANVVEYDNVKMYDIPQLIDIESTEEDEFFTIPSGYESRLDKVASDYYENSKYWWIIALFNNVDNPFLPMFMETMSIPSLTNLLLSEVI